MKRSKKLLSLLLAILLCLPVMGGFGTTTQALTEGDFEYEVDGNTASITDYTGSATDLIIPSTLGGYPVTSIGDSAFEGCGSMTRVVIPDSVTSIGEWAFEGCGSMTSVVIPNSVTSIGEWAFVWCDSLTEIAVDNGNPRYKSINGVLFTKDGTELIQYPIGRTVTTYTIPDSVISIGDYAFHYCPSLINVVIPSSLESIGNNAFHNCYALTSVEIPGSVTSIGDYAFAYCDSLTSVEIPGSVTSIGDYAFAYCDSLTSVEIGNSVESIGIYAFSDCDSLTGIYVDNDNSKYGSIDGVLFTKNVTELIQYPIGRTAATYSIPDGVTKIVDSAFCNGSSLTIVEIPNSVTSIGDDAFNYCTSLTIVEIPNSVTSIGGDAFYYCTSLTSVEIPDSVTSIAYSAFEHCHSLTSVEIPGSVTSIGNYTFSMCSSLTSVEIPGSVTFIGSYAFSMCSSLTSAYFEGMPPTFFEQEVFNDHASGFTIYYPQIYASSWAPNGETTWNGYPIAPYDSIASGAITVEDNGFDYISVLNAKNYKPIKGAAVTAYCGDSIYSNLQTDSNGLVKIDLSAAENNIDKSVRIDASVSGYNNAHKDFTTVRGESKTYTILLIPDGDETITSVTCNGKDILTGTKSISAVDSTALTVSVGTTYGSGKIKKYQLIQDGSVIASSETPSFAPILPSEFRAGIATWLRLVLVDPQNPKKVIYSEPIKLGLTTYYHHQEAPLSGSTVQLMDKLTIKVPSGIPFIGNQELEIDLGNVPLVVGYEDDTIRLGLGFTNDFDPTNDDLWHDLKRSTIDEKMNEGIKQYCASTFGTATTGWSDTTKVEVYGYAEGKLNTAPGASEPFKSLSGNVCIKVSVEFEKDWQTVVWVVPVVFKIKVKVGIENTFSVGYNYEEKQMILQDSFELVLPELELSAGIGIAKIADVSVYGSVENKIGINTETRYQYAQLEGEAGVSLFALFWTKKVPIVSGIWKYYESYKGPNSYDGKRFEPFDTAAYTMGSRDYLKTQSEWLGNIPLRDTLSSRVETLLQSSVYGATEPRIISAGDTTCMVYLADDGTRTTGNHSKLVYSLYNESNNTWSEPIAVWDDGTADFYPELATDGTDIYVTWVDANAVFDETVTMEQMAAACEISIAKLTENGFVDQTRMTSNNTLDFQPCIAFDNGEPIVVWSRNSNDDLMNQTGTNTILYAKPGDAETAAQTVATPINALAAGSMNGQAQIAYSTDADGDLNTTNDTEVYLGVVGSSFSALTNNQTFDLEVVFTNIGTRNCLTWLSEEGLKAYDGTNIQTYEVAVGSGYRVVSNESGITYLVYSMGEGDGGSLYVSQYDPESDNWREAITLSDTQGYAEHPTAVVNEQEGLLAIYTRTDATITETEVITSSDLYAIRMFPSYNLTLNVVDFDKTDVALGGELPITLNVTNTAEKEVASTTVTVSSNEGDTQTFNIDTPIASGETAELEITYLLPEVATTNEFVFTVTPVMGEGDNEFNTQDNTISKSLFSADLAVETTKLFSDSNNAVQIVVENNGFVGSNATLSIRRDTADGELLDTSDLGMVEAGSMRIITLNGDYLYRLMEGSECLYFDVQGPASDMNIGNNNSFVTVNELDTTQWVEPLDVLFGDTNGSGTVDVADAVQILRWVVKLVGDNDIDMIAANVTGNTTITAADAACILRKLVGLITQYPIEES